jgi:hypothetical protein
MKSSRRGRLPALDMASIRYDVVYAPMQYVLMGITMAVFEASIVTPTGKPLSGWSNRRPNARTYVMRLARRLGHTWFHSGYQEVSPTHLALVEAAFGHRKPLEELGSVNGITYRAGYSAVGPIRWWAGSSDDFDFFCDGVSAGFVLRRESPEWWTKANHWENRCLALCCYAQPDGLGNSVQDFSFIYIHKSSPEQLRYLQRALFLLEHDPRFPFSLSTDTIDDTRTPSLLSGDSLSAHERIGVWTSYLARTRHLGLIPARNDSVVHLFSDSSPSEDAP